MQLSISSSLQQTQLDVSQLTLSRSTATAAPETQAPAQDRIEISDGARRPHHGRHAVDNAHQVSNQRADNPQLDLLKNILEQITGARVGNLQSTPATETEADDSTTQQAAQTSLSAQQASLSIETSSLSINGAITTADGAKLSFGLDLQLFHASASAAALTASNGPDGYNFSFSGSAAELTSTSFSFSLTADMPDGATAGGNGIGSFSLKDDLKEARQTLKPLVKEFLKDSGLPDDRRSVHQLLSAIV